MQQSKRNIIILSKANSNEDAGFYQLLLKGDSALRRVAHVFLISTIEDFDHLLRNVHEDFSFLLFIHKGGYSLNPDTDGGEIAHQLSLLPYGDKLNFRFTSRQPSKTDGDIYALDFLKENLEYDAFTVNQVKHLGLQLDSGPKNEGEPTIHDRNNSNNQYDFAILTALFQDEHTAFDKEIKETKHLNDKNIKVGTFLEAKSFKSDYRGEILLSWQEKLGMVDAAAFSSRIITKFDPKFLIMGGVCGGRAGEVKLYDVIIPRKIFDYMSGKYKDGKFIPRQLQADANSDLIGYLEGKKKEIKRSMSDLASPTLEKIIEGGFDIHFANYACGPWVVKTDGTLLAIAHEIDDDIVGLEMESLGVLRAVNLFSQYGRYGLVVKSVMDFTDPKKTDGYMGNVKTTASEISYLCVRAMLPLLQGFKDMRMS